MMEYISKANTGSYVDAYKFTARIGMNVLKKSKWYWKPLMWIMLPIAPIFWAFTCRKFIRR